MKNRTPLIIAAWVIALAIAFALDARTARWLHESGIATHMREHGVLRETLKVPGYYLFTVGVAIAVLLGHRDGWRAALFLLICGAVGGLNEPIKWVVGRTRPYKIDERMTLAPFELHPFGFHKNLCFPSGHAMLAFATAAGLAILWPRWKWLWYAMALLVAVERVAENAHWLSDCVAAAALGIGAVWCVARIARGMGLHPMRSERTG